MSETGRGYGARVLDLAAAYRRTGADLPGGDPRPTHGAEMEGWFWRFTDTASGRVVVVLCGVCQHPEGPWAIVAVAAHPGRIVRSGVFPGAHAAADRFEVEVDGVLRADERSLEVTIDDVRLTASLADLVGWPLRLGAGGLGSVLPFLGQYWQPHALGGRATGSIAIDGTRWPLDGADVYAEKNWGDGFPDRWWWGQAQGFTDPDLCVAFGGGRFDVGPVGVDITGCVVRVGERVLRFVPPTARVRPTIGSSLWEVRARRLGWRLLIEGDGSHATATVLPVPIPAERRIVDRDLEHQGAHLRVRLWRRGTLVVDDRSELAALEVGAIDPAHVEELADDHDVPQAEVGT